MELSKKTTILFPPDLHARLVNIARLRKTSLGELVRAACEAEFGRFSTADRLRAVEEMAQMQDPVGTVEELKSQYVAPYKELPS